ncbi:MAG: glycosyltransferase family 2 protein [Acidobacteriaceae bacterium]
MNHHHRISVAMCTYNGSQFLPEQLASIVRQIRLPDEMVICDDGSKDTTSEIVERFSRDAPFPVRFIRNPENLGSTKNFEKAIGLCTGDLIALSDQDDIWMPQKLAIQSEMMESDMELGGVFSDAELINDRSQPIGRRLWSAPRFTARKQGRFRSGDAISVLLERNVAWGATMMIRSNVRHLFSDIPKPWIHDAWITWMLVLYSKMEFTPEPLIEYRLHIRQVTGIEELIRPRPLTLLERLLKGKREEPAKHLARARELEVLYERLMTRQDPRSQAVLPALRQAIRFFTDCGTPYSNYLLRTSRILRNTWNYQRYEHGWKSLIRDLVLMLIPMEPERSVKP